MTQQIWGFCGRKGSGKDTAAIPLLDAGFKLLKFADPLKAMTRALFRTAGVDDNTIDYYIEGNLKEVCLDIFEGCSTRYVMQTLGVQWGRQSLGDNLWVNTFKRRAAGYPLVVCTDVRFQNEVDAIYSMGGKVIKINRSNLPVTDTHISETSIDDLVVDMIIRNDGSVEDLHDTVKRVVLR